MWISDLLCGITVSVLLHNPLAEGLPLFIPLLQTLGLNAISILTEINITNPFDLVLIFEVAPPDAVLRQCSLLFVSPVLLI